MAMTIAWHLCVALIAAALVALASLHLFVHVDAVPAVDVTLNVPSSTTPTNPAIATTTPTPTTAAHASSSLSSLLSRHASRHRPHARSAWHARRQVEELVSPPPLFTINVNGAPWLTSGDVFFYGANNALYSWQAGTLFFVSSSTSSGVDEIGAFNRTDLSWSTTPSASIDFVTTVRLYSSLLARPTDPVDPSNVRAVAFEQYWPNAVNQTSAPGGSDTVLSAFPSFALPDAPGTLGFMEYGGMFFVHGPIARWDTKAHLYEHTIEGGPFVLFDQTATVAAMVSSLTHHMASSTARVNGSIALGVMGGVTSIPAGYSIAHLVYFDDVGVSATMIHWGDVMLAKFGKVRANAWNDYAVRWLGYNTNNGAYYYYNTEPNKNYEETLLDVQAYAANVGIPYRWVWIDSWFYYKGVGGGIMNWTSRPDVFPDGMPALHTKLEWPIIAHNRYWSANNVYAKQNGGEYDFLIDGDVAMPLTQALWDHLFSTATTWGLTTYQQDWLWYEFENFPPALQQVHLGRQWLLEMGNSAAQYGLTVQYCLALPRHIMQSVEIPAVTQARVSEDYNPDNQQWMIGDTSILAYALGIVPLKDDFWTTTTQPGNTYNLTENHPDFQAALATLSTGPVTPSDGINYSDPELIARSVRSDGLILKPDVPLFSLDSMFAYRAFGANGPAGYVYTTHTTVAGQVWYAIFVANLTKPYELSIDELVATTRTTTTTTTTVPQSFAVSAYTLYEWSVLPQLLTSSTPLVLNACNQTDFSIYYVTPFVSLDAAQSQSVALFGETSKWTPMSRQRVQSLSSGDDSVRIELLGAPNEEVAMQFAAAATSSSSIGGDSDRTPLVPNEAVCVIGADGRATMIITETSTLCA